MTIHRPLEPSRQLELDGNYISTDVNKHGRQFLQKASWVLLHSPLQQLPPVRRKTHHCVTISKTFAVPGSPTSKSQTTKARRNHDDHTSPPLRQIRRPRQNLQRLPGNPEQRLQKYPFPPLPRHLLLSTNRLFPHFTRNCPKTLTSPRKVVHVCHDLPSGKREIPALLRGEVVTPQSGMGTNAEEGVATVVPRGIVIGKGFSEEEVQELREACKGERKVAWLVSAFSRIQHWVSSGVLVRLGGCGDGVGFGAEIDCVGCCVGCG